MLVWCSHCLDTHKADTRDTASGVVVHVFCPLEPTNQEHWFDPEYMPFFEIR